MKYYLDSERNLTLFQRICKDGEVMTAVDNYIAKNYTETVKFSKLLLKNKWTRLAKMPRILRLSATVMCLDEVYGKYKEMGFDDEIFFDTMSDIKEWIEDCRLRFGEIGLDEINWLRLHVTCQIFKIGRLQYQLCKYYFAPKTKIDGAQIKKGEKCFNIHIPRGERLDTAACVDSVKRAAKLLGNIFPKVRNDLMVCHSWLLDSHNKDFVKDGGNIIKFASLFKSVGESPTASEHFRWVFGLCIDEKQLQNNKKTLGYYYDLSKIEIKSSLQNSMKRYIENGGTLADGMGVLPVRSLSCLDDRFCF